MIYFSSSQLFFRVGFFLATFSFLSSCSTYSTNTDIKFESLQIEQRPELFIGEEDFESFRLDYLGWVEAKVTPPSFFHSKPTKAQADVVLARLGLERGAQGVFFVTYEWDVFGTLRAKGQAVKIYGLDRLATYKEKLQKKKEEEKSRKINKLMDENVDNPAVILDVEDDPLAKAYMQANSIEDQIADAGPTMISIAEADLLVTLEQLRNIQELAFENKDIAIYQAVSEMLKNLAVYE